MIVRVELPQHLRTLARIASIETSVTLASDSATIAAVLEALESDYPMLRGTIRDRITGQRRPFLRFFACQQDLSHLPHDTPLPNAITSGREPLLIIGAVAGG